MDFDSTMEKAAYAFIEDVIRTGKETITVEIDDDFCQVSIGNAGGAGMHIDDFSGNGIGEIIAGFVILIISASNESNDNLNFKLTENTESKQVVEVTKVSH